MQWQKQDHKKENVSFKSPRKKDGYSKESNDQQAGPKANSLHTMETLPRRTSFCCCSKPVSRMLAAALEWLKDFAIGAIMESRKGQDQRQLPASLATTFPRICHRRKNLLALNRTLQGTRYKLSILKVIYKMFHNLSPSSMSIRISKSQPLFADSYSIF